jgi:hypothetical protein
MSKPIKSTPSVMEAITVKAEQAGAGSFPTPPASLSPVSTAPIDATERATEDTKPAPLSSEEDPLLNLTEAGKRCNRSRQAISDWCDQGIIEYVRLPGFPVGRRAIRQSTIDRFIGGTNVLAPRGSAAIPLGFQHNNGSTGFQAKYQPPLAQGSEHNGDSELASTGDPSGAN